MRRISKQPFASADPIAGGRATFQRGASIRPKGSSAVEALDRSGLAHLVSVVTPAHDSVAFVARAIHSVAEQTVPVLEHIIVDDGSTDGTADLVESLQNAYPHLVYLRQRRRGSAAARNRGIEHAGAKYIAFLDSDDCWLPQKNELQVRFMQRTGAVFTYGGYEKRCPHTDRLLASYEPPPSLGHEQLLNGCPVGCLTVAYNQQLLGKRYMPEVRRGQDWGLWLALTRDGVRAQRYPGGQQAVYHHHNGTLSSNKLYKTRDIYRIYRTEESLSRLAALRRLGRHVFSALRKP